jgi:hypothetical protein
MFIDTASYTYVLKKWLRDRSLQSPRRQNLLQKRNLHNQKDSDFALIFAI